MLVFYPIVKLFKYLRVIMMQTYKSLDLFLCKLDVIPADFSTSVLCFFSYAHYCVMHVSVDGSCTMCGMVSPVLHEFLP